MKIFRLFFISVVFFFLLVTVLSLFIPSEVRISRAVNILSTASQVWSRVDNMRTWSEWNPFFAGVSENSIVFSGAAHDKTATMVENGSFVKWKEIKADERIVTIEKKNQPSLVSGWKMIAADGSDSVTLQWYLDIKLRWYPWEKFASLLFEKSYGARMEQGLSNLKNTVQTNRTSNN